jgi:hypothetical protein
MDDLGARIAAKKAELDRLRPAVGAGLGNLEHTDDLKLIYTSNAIEGTRSAPPRRHLSSSKGSQSAASRSRIISKQSTMMMRHTSFTAMQELPHGLPLVQCKPLVSAALPLRQELMNCFRASPVMPLACVLQSFIRYC